MTLRARSRLQHLVLALLAYVPALCSRPGQMPTDTKLYLYLNPGRLMSDALSTWDTRQFGGWVPHQVIAYLWPQGPWYWFFDRIGVPDWVAHRLWIGTLLFVAAAGVFWAARTLGLHRGGALVAAAVYQLSPYILPYISRTSAMLLPWAAVGWLVGLTVRATLSDRRWKFAALMALVILTCSAVNATAVMMIAPAPLLWLVHACWGRTVTLRRAFGTAVRVGVLSLGVSLWWITMLRIQGRYGADVLSYSESLQATSFTSTSLETLRGMGYWLAFIRDPFASTTTAARTYMESGAAIFISFALTGLCLLGLSLVRWAHRRYAALLVVCGIVLAVGVHPIWNSSPLMRPLAERSRSGIALALRSSTRALPVSSFGLALGIGALCTAVAATRFRWRVLAVPAAVALAVVNLPALFTGDLVDPALARQQDPPAAWTEAAATLDQTSLEHRVLQLPGSEFGAFDWGYTVDPPLPGLTKKPLITRDLLPLGSAGMMDLLYALDDRVQQSILDPQSLSATASLLAADTVWLANDLASERFRTPHAAVAAASIIAGTRGDVLAIGTPTHHEPKVPWLDEHSLAGDDAMPLPPVYLVDLPGAQSIIRTKQRTDIVVGSGDGIIDAAAAGVLNGNEAVVYSADQFASPNGPLAHITPSLVVLTDSNRARAHHWRSSQDVTGFTESGCCSTDVLKPDEGDQRLPVFGVEPDARDQTTATLDTGLRVTASGYGEPFAYRPEQRPAMAVDGDLATAWVVGDRSNPVGEYLVVSKASGTLQLRQADRSNAAFTANRMITAVQLISGDGRSSSVRLTGESLIGNGQVVPIPGTGSLTIRIEAVGKRKGGTDTGASGVGFAELGLGTHREVVTTPRLPASASNSPMAVVLTRLRSDPENRWRSDPEPTLDRAFTTAGATSFTGSLQLQLDHRASDDVLLQFDSEHAGGTTASDRLTGAMNARGVFATDGDITTAWTSPFGKAIGTSLRLTTTEAISSFELWQPNDSKHSLITAVTLTSGDSPPITAAVPAPDSKGRSTIALPSPLVPGIVTIAIDKEKARTTIDRRYGERTVLPVSIAEIQAQGILTTTGAGDYAPGCGTAPVAIDGVPLTYHLDGAVMAALGRGSAVRVELCNPVTLSPGTHHLVSEPGVLQTNQVVLRNSPASPTPDSTTVTGVERTRSSRTVTVAPCPTGCWLVMGEGWNAAWKAHLGSTDLGIPVQIDGGSNGWWLPASSQQRTITLEWPPQGSLNWSLVLSTTAILACLAVALRRRAAPFAPIDTPPTLQRVAWRRRSLTRSMVVAAGIVVCTALIASPSTALWAIIPASAVVATRRPRIAMLVGVVVFGGLSAIVLLQHFRHGFRADAGWPLHFERVHVWGMLVVALVGAGAALDSD